MLILIVLCATVSDNPIAFNTCDDSMLPVVHALSVDMYIPFSSSSCNILSASTNSKEILIFPGSLFIKSPFIFTPFIFF